MLVNQHEGIEEDSEVLLRMCKVVGEGPLHRFPLPGSV